VAGDYPPAVDDATAWLEISGLTNQPGPRQYKVHVPTGYDCHVPTPVLFCIHGLQQNGVMFCVNGTSGKTAGAKGFVDKSNEAGFILVIPNGYMSSWNGGSGHYGAAATMNLDDVGLMKAILAQVKTHVNVDARKVYTAGLSNGAYMSYRLACEAADVFTAAAPGAGGIVDKTGCSPSQPISILDLHGTADNLVPFSEQTPSADAIATKNGCTTTTAAATVPASGGDTTCVTYSGCPSGIEVTRCSIQGGGHVWFGDPSCGTGAGALGCGVVGANSTFLNNTDAAWDFFKRLSR
jgi:polyhydroxybutyrate depolymerase